MQSVKGEGVALGLTALALERQSHILSHCHHSFRLLMQICISCARAVYVYASFRYCSSCV